MISKKLILNQRQYYFFINIQRLLKSNTGIGKFNMNESSAKELLTI